ncbi:MAG: hypothetical protein IKO03_16360 [Lachnospiraceae bacterium]|nr:hypothetical protein [Lachnospiraceae bacterium]
MSVMEGNGNHDAESVKRRDDAKYIEKVGFYKLLELIRRVPEGEVIRVELSGEDGKDGRNE